MFRWLLLAIAGYIVYLMFRNDSRAKMDAQKRGEAAGGEAAGDMARDPVCGTFVNMADAVTVRDGGKRYYFCSYDCREEFLKRMQGGESPESIAQDSQAASKKNSSESSEDKP